MRQIYNFNTKWGFSKEALEAPTTMPKDGTGSTYHTLGTI